MDSETVTPESLGLEAPAAPAAAPPAPAAAPTGVAPVAQPTTDTGSAPAVTEGVPAPTATTPAAEPVTEAPKFYEAIGPDGGPFQIPLGVKFPFKRGDETGQMSIEDITKSPMLYADYQAKMRERAERERQRDQQIERQRVEYEARLESATSMRPRLVVAAAQGGEAYAKELRHQEMMETDPDYRQRWEESEEYRIGQAVTQHDAGIERAARTESVTTRVRDYIGQACAKHPGLDPVKVERLYGMALRSGQADLSADAVDAIIAEETAQMTALTQPLRAELESLKSQFAGLTAQLQANQHNSQTSAAIDRAKGVTPGRPANGAPPAPSGARKPFNPMTDDPDAYLASWVAEGRRQ